MIDLIVYSAIFAFLVAAKRMATNLGLLGKEQI
jgi:hypothetical protein